MSPRIFIAAIGAAAAVVGLVFLVAVPIAVSDARGTSLRCGTAVNRDENAAKDYYLDERRRELQATLDVTTGKPTGPGSGTPIGGYSSVARPDCDGAVGLRRGWTIPLAVVGLVAIIGAAVVRTS
jgi:hypothetical protein